MTLRPLTLAECQLVREWRNDPVVLPMLRTGYKTEEQQAAFYRDVVRNAASDHRYFGLWHNELVFVGMGGLTYLSRTPGEAEISLIIDPLARGRGIGASAVDALLAEAWRMGLRSVVGECYPQGNQPFWGAQTRRIPVRSHGIGMGGVYSWRWERETAVNPAATFRETR